MNPKTPKPLPTYILKAAIKNTVPIKRKINLPKPLPTYIVKCSWDATAVKLKIQARNADEAIDKGWMRVSRMEGGMSCLSVKVIDIRS